MFLTNQGFDQDISAWNVSSVTNMDQMFRGSIFNQDISSWNVGNVTNMHRMFYQDFYFNQDISAWNVSSVDNMDRMFQQTAINKNLSSWNINSLTTAASMFRNAYSMSTENYTDTIVGWAVFVYNNSGSPSSVNMSAQTSQTFDGTRTSDAASGQTYVAKYGSSWPSTWNNNNAQDALDYLTTTLSWSINSN
jgi:surface protein